MSILSGLTTSLSYICTTGEISQECGNWCSGNQTNSSCVNSNWKQYYCDSNNLLFDDICRDYCNEGGTYVQNNSSIRDWCRAQRKSACAATLEDLKSRSDSVGLSDFLNGKSSAGAACACYLPSYVHTLFAADFLSKMGNANEVVTEYVNTNKECLFPACSRAAAEYQPKTCPSEFFCIQNVSIDIGSNNSISGSVGSTQSQQCSATINQNGSACTYTYGNWGACTNGEQTRTKTPQTASSTCTSTTETQSCTTTATSSSNTLSLTWIIIISIIIFILLVIILVLRLKK